MTNKYPHLSLRTVLPAACDQDRSPAGVWQCDYCGRLGTFEDLAAMADCTYVGEQGKAPDKDPDVN